MTACLCWTKNNNNNNNKNVSWLLTSPQLSLSPEHQVCVLSPAGWTPPRSPSTGTPRTGPPRSRTGCSGWPRYWSSCSGRRCWNSGPSFRSSHRPNHSLDPCGPTYDTSGHRETPWTVKHRAVGPSCHRPGSPWWPLTDSSSQLATAVFTVNRAENRVTATQKHPHGASVTSQQSEENKRWVFTAGINKRNTWRADSLRRRRPNGQLSELSWNCHGRAAPVCLHPRRHSVLASDWINRSAAFTCCMTRSNQRDWRIGNQETSSSPCGICGFFCG